MIKITSYIVQHKIISAVVLITLVIVVPNISGGGNDYPKACYANQVRVEMHCNAKTSIYGKITLARLVEEEDPDFKLGRHKYLTCQTDIFYNKAVLSKLFSARYEKLSRTAGKESAENFLTMVKNDCAEVSGNAVR